MQKKVCPYPGLRPFTENESIFFKGREVHIRQIIRQLEEKKFVMITGASGDGKSSLVYAGVIPNARAGFFRAQYGNWLITDFRPERSPLKNLSETISRHLELELEYVEEELSYGFSALVNLYKESKFYINTASAKWKNANEQKRKELKRSASNLFILADQFEEFFTNAENFTNNKPSATAYTTINLLLETARIAAAEDLPIYIAFTMRSDFISQSVAFKGLPEFIGFSQFFVPRLKRNELQQIIEEPAVLSGGKVSKSLSEKLINDLPNGFDQLPLLQHIMNRLWQEADNGNQELGLLHLAKIAGLPGKMLSENEREAFYEWQLEIEQFKQVYYDKPRLTNVLNTHANILYEKAFDYFSENIDWAKQNITKEEAQYILKVAFKSLTKIDQGRAVRNRMTLREITQIINKPHITYETVCGVLNIFRLQDSTFVRPFIETKDIATQYLSANDTFDITHEALIRNWDLLKKWEAEEVDNLSNLKDFQVQLNRWKENDKSDSFLLTAGTLSYFEEWYKKSEPNKFWIAKYDTSAQAKEEKLENAEALHNEIKEYLKASKDFLIAQRRKQKRLRSILLIAAVVIIAILSGVAFLAQQARKFAEEQKEQIELEKKEAENQRKIAEDEKEKTKEALKLAEENRRKAEKNAYEAELARILSDSAKTEAEKMRSLAELSSDLAKKEAKNAKKEKNIADSLRLISDKEKEIAQQERKRADKLSYLAMAQSLALRAKQNHNDPQINLLLAYQAYKFNKENGGDSQDPEIFKALNFVLQNYGKQNLIPVSKNQFKAFAFAEEGFNLLTKNGNFENYPISGGNPKTEKSVYSKISLFNQVPLNSGYFLGNNMAVVGFENKNVVLWNLKEEKSRELGAYKNYIRGAETIGNNKIAIVDRSPAIKIWSLNNKNKKPVKEIKFDSRINDICFEATQNKLFAACNNGDFSEINLNDYSVKTISTKAARATSLALSDDKMYLAIGFSNGEVALYKTGRTQTKQFEIFASNAGVNDIVFDKSSNYLILATNDKKISFFEIENIKKSPITITDHNQNVKALTVKDNKLYALCYDNTIRYWQLSLEEYAEQVKSAITRELSPDEWTKFVGNDIKQE